MRVTAALVAALLLLGFASLPQAQGPAPATPLTLVSSQGRRPVPTTIANGQELIALDDVATLFGVTVREDALAGGITVSYKGRSVVASPDQPMASVNGRLVPLPSPAVRNGRRWLVPVEFLPRALASIYDTRIELRRPARLLLLGDVRVPRLTVRLDGTGPTTRVTIELTPVTVVAPVAESGQVQLRIEADAVESAALPGGTGAIDGVRLDGTTLTLALTPRAGTPRITPATAENTTRVTVDVPTAQTDTTQAPASPTGAAAASGGPAATPAGAPPSTPTPPAPLTAEASDTGFRTIVLDPGHGGTDAGASGTGGAQEKQITLDVARRIKALIESRLGLRVILTREDDRAVPLDERAALANNNKADLFLSLHLNAAVAPAVTGAEIYQFRLDREAQDALRSAAADGLTLPVPGGGTRRVDVIRWDLAQARHVDESAAFAGLLEAELRGRIPLAPRTVRQAPMRVLSGLDMPAVLIELAYLSNPDQEQAAQSGEFQGAVAQAVLTAITRFAAGEQATQAPAAAVAAPAGSAAQVPAAPVQGAPVPKALPAGRAAGRAGRR